jgi:hypothetical protein
MFVGRKGGSMERGMSYRGAAVCSAGHRLVGNAGMVDDDAG